MVRYVAIARNVVMVKMADILKKVAVVTKW
jgi:hypothetical protein